MTEASTSELEQEVEVLRKQHTELGEKLDLMENDPLVDHLEIQEMKKQKLFLKDSISSIERKLDS